MHDQLALHWICSLPHSLHPLQDLVKAFELVLANPLAIGEVFNISGPRYVTFDGIALACAEAMGKPPPELVHYNPKDYDFGKKKAFPLRDQVMRMAGPIGFFSCIAVGIMAVKGRSLFWGPLWQPCPLYLRHILRSSALAAEETLFSVRVAQSSSRLSVLPPPSLLTLQHFFASNDKAEDLLGWRPQFGLVDGLRDSYLLDYSRGRYCKDPDFETDDIILAGKKAGAVAPAAAAAAV